MMRFSRTSDRVQVIAGKSVRSRLRLGDRSVKRSAASSHRLAKFLPFFGGHLFPALNNSSSRAPTPAGPSAESAEKNLAENQNSDSLPDGDDVQTKERRHQPVPKRPDRKRKHNQTHNRETRNVHCTYYPMSIHSSVPAFSFSLRFSGRFNGRLAFSSIFTSIFNSRSPTRFPVLRFRKFV